MARVYGGGTLDRREKPSRDPGRAAAPNAQQPASARICLCVRAARHPVRLPTAGRTSLLWPAAALTP